MAKIKKKPLQLSTSAGFLSFSVEEELAGLKIGPKEAIIFMIVVTLVIQFIGALAG